MKTLFIRLSIILCLALTLHQSQAQSYRFRFDTPIEIPTRIDLTSVYAIPPDSVADLVFGDRGISVHTPWLQQALFRAGTRTFDSIFRSSRVSEGYYLVVQANDGFVNFSIRRKEGFYSIINDMRDLLLLDVRQMDHQKTNNVEVRLKNKVVPYHENLRAYVLDPDDGDRLEIRMGKDVEVYVCEKKKFKPYRYNGYNNYRPDKRVAYKGYLVTNQPKYLPGDTVKYKAYLLDERTNEPIKEPIEVTLGYYPEFRMEAIDPKAPGVYYSEFVLGDSIKPDRNYELKLTGLKTGAAMSRTFTVEDYLLNETFLRVTGEPLPNYQPGDSIQLYAFAYNSNGLPVLDGTLTVTVVPEHYTLKAERKKSIFIPDTLYHQTVAVHPEGDTYIGFPTQAFPDLQRLTLRCYVSLVNSNFEKKDTVFNLYYDAQETYFKITERGDTIRAELIKNKRSVPGKGYLLTNRNDSVKIVYPFETRMDESTFFYRFLQVDDTGGPVNDYSHNLAADSLVVLDDYVKDTAYLRVVNPKKVWFRYTLYKGNDHIAHGTAEGDTVLKIRSKKGETFTMLLNYSWATQNANKVATVFKINKQMTIDVKKKDVVYPGQTDTIGVRLSDGEGDGIANTNVTVLAFTSKFQEDHVPRLAAAGYIKPGLGNPRYTRSVTKLYERYNKPAQPLSKEWARLLHIDTAYYYKHIYFNDSHIALYSFKLLDSLKTQLAVYIREGNQYVQPQAIYYGSNKLLYARMLSVSTDYHALLLKEGTYNILVRTKDSLYNIRNLELEKGYKTNLFINADELDRTNDTLIRPYVSRQRMPDSLAGWERDAIARSMFLYRGERYNNYSIVQGDLVFHSYNAQNTGFENFTYDRNYYHHDNKFLSFGPVSLEDSAGFFEPNVMKQRFIPELHFIYTFRPGMMRLEKYGNYELLKGKLQANYITPQFNKTTVPAKPFGLLEVFAKPAETKPRLPYQEYVVLENSWTNHDHFTAGLEIQLPGARARKAVVLRRVNDTLKPFVSNSSYGNISVRTRPGAYTVLVLWNDSTSTLIDNIVLKEQGTTVVSVNYDSTRFDMTRVPKWLKHSVTLVSYDTVQLSTISYPLREAGDVGGVSGQVLDESKQPIIGAIVEVFLDGVSRGGCATDEDGKYTIKPLVPGLNYVISAKYTGYQEIRLTGLQITADRMTYQNFHMKALAHNIEEVVIMEYKKPLIKKDATGATTFTGEQISKMATINTSDVASLSGGTYQQKSGSSISIGGARASAAMYVVDGISMNDWVGEGGTAKPGKERYLKSDKAQAFIADFINNMQGASGLRRQFRDWAIWEPDLWTDRHGNTSFAVKYPDDVTSWKTYVLAMNPKGFSGSTIRLTRAFKPLSAELSAPRFLRYGDTVEMVGKVMNYSGQPFGLKTTFTQQDRKVVSGQLTVQNARVEQLPVPAPPVNSTDTLTLPLSYSLQTENGYTDGEERKIPVYPVGVTEHKGQFVSMMRDTTILSKPSDTSGYFTGKTTINIDGSLLEVLLREIENLKVYPHGCTEQLTTKLLAIYYEEEVKKLLGNDTLNNKKAKREILDKLVLAQRRDGSFGWFAGNSTDYRITNYVLSTLQKVNKDGWLDLIIRRGLDYLNSNLETMDQASLIASLTTLSRANYASNYKAYTDKLAFKDLSLYTQFAIAQIKKEQGLPYRAQLDTMMAKAQQSPNGMSWGYPGYDWYRNDLATTLLAYQLVSKDSIYGKHKDAIVQYLLYKRKNGYYGNTAESGLVLTTLLPEIISNNKPDANTKRKTEVYISGALQDTVRRFPAYYVVRDKAPAFSFTKDGFSPAYVSVVYEYFNKQPKHHAGAFKITTTFLKVDDTVASLRQGEKVQLRVKVEALKDAEYVMVEIPIPAGCVQADKRKGNYYFEASRENYKDRTVVYLNRLDKGTYTFDVVLEARYKGIFHLNPASASMMYYPEEYGNDEVRKVRVD